MKILWIFLGDHHKIRLHLGVNSMHFGVFFKVNVQNGGILGGGGCYNFKYIGLVLEIPVFFFFFFFFCFFFCFFGGGGGCTVDAGPEPTYEEKMRVPPHPTPWDCRMTTTKSCRFVRGRDATVALPALNRTSTVLNRGGNMSIRGSTVVSRSTAVMSHSGSVDESCRHRRSIVRHRVDAGISFFPSRRIPMQPDFTICLKSG